jgi:hypothetical protein
MTTAGPATSTVLSPCLIRARLSSQGPVVRQGLAVANTPITIAE